MPSAFALNRVYGTLERLLMSKRGYSLVDCGRGIESITKWCALYRSLIVTASSILFIQSYTALSASIEYLML
jgi:hypothetical protein